MSLLQFTMGTMENFSSWITRKFVEWQAHEGKRKSIEEFAAYLGTSRPLVNMWMNGNKKPGVENIKILAELFGNEIYDVLNLPRPNPYLQIVNRAWDNLSEELQIKISKEVEINASANSEQQFQKISKRTAKAKSK